MTWLDGYQRVDLGKTGGPYDRMDHPKLCWHTTEGGSLGGAETAFYPYPPHLGVDPDSGACHQYLDLDRHAYSLGNSDAENSFVIQVEVVGYAAESHTWSARRLEWLADHVVIPVQTAVGVPPVGCPQGFHGEGEGMILASSSSPIRMSLSEWDGFAGHVGHQHCPGDDHWDPGRLDIQTILDAAEGTEPQPEPEQDDDMGLTICRAASGDPQYLTDMATFKTPIANPAARDAIVWCVVASGGKLYYNPDVNDPVIVPDEVLAALPETEP